MSYKDYLQKRTDYYVIESFTPNSLSKFNSADEFNVLLKRIDSIAMNISQSLLFLEEHNDDVIAVINGTLDKLEAKVQSIKRSAKAISKSNKNTGLISDVSEVDITQGTFQGLNYSITNEGLILSSSDSVKIL